MQIDALVFAAVVDLRLPPQAGSADLDELASELREGDAPDPSVKTFAVRILIQREALGPGPRADEIPGALQGIRLVENALQKGGQSEHHFRRLAVGASNLEIPLQTHLREQGGEME